jgi:hypothetical protein
MTEIKEETGLQEEASDNEESGDAVIDSDLHVLQKAPRKVNKKVLQFISEEAARKYGMVAFERVDGVLRVAMLDPQNLEALNVLRFLAEKEKLDIDIYGTSEGVFRK